MPYIKLNNISCEPPEGADKKAIKEQTREMKKQLDSLQNKLYASRKHAILVVLQGMDASGKDGAVKNVFDGINPEGVKVHSFKVPTQEELYHDFLWRVHAQTPEKGMIQIFNRSHYEDILVTRVHKLINNKTARQHIKDINAFEQLLLANNTHILKFFLHITREEQSKRLKERLIIPQKMWKYNAGDKKEAEYWDEYRYYYEEAISQCSIVPWTIVPANKNWYKEYIITKSLYECLSSLDLKYPAITQP